MKISGISFQKVPSGTVIKTNRGEHITINEHTSALIGSNTIVIAQKPPLDKTLKELLSDGWSFSYEPETQYIGINHPAGGKQSLLSFSSKNRGDQFGELIAGFLNKR